MFRAKSWCALTYGGAEGTRTHDLCVANRITGKTLSICLFESCSHQEKSRVFTFFPILYRRVHVTSCFFWLRIGHLKYPVEGTHHHEKLSDAGKRLASLTKAHYVLRLAPRPKTENDSHVYHL